MSDSPHVLWSSRRCLLVLAVTLLICGCIVTWAGFAIRMHVVVSATLMPTVAPSAVMVLPRPW